MDDGISTSREISTGKKRSYIGLRVGNVSNPSDRTLSAGKLSAVKDAFELLLLLLEKKKVIQRAAMG